jgi:hypothetical protein
MMDQKKGLPIRLGSPKIVLHEVRTQEMVKGVTSQAKSDGFKWNKFIRGDIT